jgi:hypothetical protein
VTSRRAQNLRPMGRCGFTLPVRVQCHDALSWTSGSLLEIPSHCRCLPREHTRHHLRFGSLHILRNVSMIIDDRQCWAWEGPFSAILTGGLGLEHLHLQMKPQQDPPFATTQPRPILTATQTFPILRLVIFPHRDYGAFPCSK